eukprot:TRINITY_DN1544_c0_g1_i2.p1 TRINITY_DN1544_c0_g1~~TRINITY_DN1544_c0_g1_i2.p1  ORF type:complete len:203 (+),score=21.50 TRINITY_DN1544_c0_g1_i2:215-823(+)
MVMTRSDGPVTSGHRSTQRHPGNGSCGSYILITVGTTDFDELIGAGSDEAFVQLAHKLGFDEIRLQIGRGAVPANPVFVLDSDHNVTSRQGELQEGGVRCTYYRLKQTLLEEIRNASLVVTHAGAPTWCVEMRWGGNGKGLASWHVVLFGHVVGRKALVRRLRTYGHPTHDNDPRCTLSARCVLCSPLLRITFLVGCLYACS